MSAILEWGLLLALIVGNGLLSMSETAVVTARRARLEQRADAGDARARAAARLKDRPTRFLAAVQVGITLVGIVSGALGGSRLARHLAGPLARVDALAPYAHAIALVVTVALVTYLSLIVGELVPKRIALADPEGVAARIARPMRRVAWVATPVVAVLAASTRAVMRLLRIDERDGSAVTEHEIRHLIAQGARAGIVQAAEEDILERVFYLGDRQVGAVMTPRPDVRWIAADASPAAILDALGDAHHPRLLVGDGTLDRVVGIVDTADLLRQCLRGERLDPRRVLQPPHDVSVSTPVLELLQDFRRSATQLGVVRDDDGAVVGVVSLDDILHDLVEYIPRKVGPRAADVVYAEDGTWLLDGGVPLAAVERALGEKILPPTDARGQRTLEDFVRERVGRTPAVGDGLVLEGFRFEVVDMDGQVVDRVRVSRAPGEPDAPPPAAATDDAPPGR